MAYSEELSPRSGPHDYDYELPFCGLPVLDVGWLELPHPIPTGQAPPGFTQRLFAFCRLDRLVGLTMGHQRCGYCAATFHQLSTQYHTPLGNGEIRVLGDGVAYAAPSLIYHYVTAHAYLPPPAFIAAVMDGPDPDSPSLRKYRFHWWEATIYSAVRHSQSLDSPKRVPPPAPGVILSPLIWRYRAIAIVAILTVSILLVHPGGIWVTAPMVLMLAAAIWLLRVRLTCPVCDKRLQLMLREPTDWSLPPDGPFATMYCDGCGIGYRPSTDLWGAPVAEVATTWG
jgi:hypothetical protein